MSECELLTTTNSSEWECVIKTPFPLRQRVGPIVGPSHKAAGGSWADWVGGRAVACSDLRQPISLLSLWRTGIKGNMHHSSATTGNTHTRQSDLVMLRGHSHA